MIVDFSFDEKACKVTKVDRNANIRSSTFSRKEDLANESCEEISDSEARSDRLHFHTTGRFDTNICQLPELRTLTVNEQLHGYVMKFHEFKANDKNQSG